MGFNVGEVTKENVSFGPGVLYAGAAGVCPMIDVGAVRSGAVLTITRTKITLEQGSPYQKIGDWVVREVFTLAVTGVEWNYDNLVLALGAGESTTPNGDKRLRLGGDMGVCEFSLCYRHHFPNDDEGYFKFWKAIGGGEIAITFGDELHEFPYTFEAIQPNPLRTWVDDPHDPDAALPNKEHLFESYRAT